MDMNINNSNYDALDFLEASLNLKEEERWENLTLANDFLFGKVFQDPELCLELVQMILPELNIERIAFTEMQKSSRETLDTRGVRFDVYLRDDKNRIINVEMQTVNRDNIIKRSRAYHSVVDLDAMDRETTKLYNDIPEAIVIFICCFDLFHAGRHIYTFRKFCVQDKSLMLDDGETTMFLNTKGTKDDISPKLKAFLDFIEGRYSDNELELVKNFERKLFEVKQNRYWRQRYMLTKFDRNSYIEEGRVQGLATGLEEGRAAGLLEGRAEGLLEGRTAGLAEGRTAGLAEGRIEERKDMFDAVKNFMKTSGLTSLNLEQITQLIQRNDNK